MSLRLVLLVVTLATTTLGAPSVHANPASDPESRSTGAAAALRGERDGGAIALPADVTARADLEIATAVRAEAAPEITAFGRVLDPLPLVDALQARRAARSACDAARTEYARVAALRRHDANASTRDLEAARVALDRAIAETATAAARVTLTWGADGGDDLGRFVEALGAGRTAVARIDLPATERVAATPTITSLVAVGNERRPVAARVLGPAPTTDPVLQGQAFLLMIEAEPPPPGTALVATVLRSPRPSIGAAVPRSAIVWLDGRPFAYAAVKPDLVERRAIVLAATVGDSWLVTSGVAPGERIVVQGAQQLLSAELLHGGSAHDGP